MSVLTITHVDMYGIPSRDMARSIEFYTSMFGLVPDKKEKSELWAGDLCLSIWEPEKFGMPFEANNNGPALHVDDVPAAREKLEAAGVKFLGENIDSGVCHLAMFEDPDGNQLMLHNRYSPA